MVDRILKQYTYSHLSQEEGKFPVFLGCETNYRNFDQVIKAISEFAEEIKTEDDESVFITNRGMEHQMYLHAGNWIFLDEDLKLFSVPNYLVKFLFVEVKHPYDRTFADDHSNTN